MGKNLKDRNTRYIIPPEEETLDNMLQLLKTTTKIKEYMTFDETVSEPIEQISDDQTMIPNVVCDLKTLRQDHMGDVERHQALEKARSFRWAEFGYAIAIYYARQQEK